MAEFKLNVDFSALEACVRKMGAEGIDPGQVVVLNRRPAGPIVVTVTTLKEVKPKPPGGPPLLGYKGRHVLLYIQDHGPRVRAVLQGASEGNRFHVADGPTLKSMRTQNRYERYVVTNRTDGRFHICGIDPITGANVEGGASLPVCRNCLRTLN